MTAGGRSSSDLYGIGHPEVDALTALALKQPGVLGARIMGGGEGGAALLLIRTEAWQAVAGRPVLGVLSAPRTRIGKNADSVPPGARRVALNRGPR